MHDFTTVLDERKMPQTVGFIVELSGMLSAFAREDSTDRSTKYFAGPNSRITAQRLFDVLGAANNEYKHPMQSGETRLQTIRVVEPGVHGISSMEGQEDEDWFRPGQGPCRLVTCGVPRMDIREGDTGTLMPIHEHPTFEWFVLDVGTRDDCGI